MKVLEHFFIGDAWQSAFELILKEGTRINDGDQELLELLNLHLIINTPNEDDPLVDLQDESMKNWMRENFTEIKRVPELNDSWSYGWRLYDYQGVNQIDWVINKLKNKPESKSATISMLQKAGEEPYVPCVSLLDFKIRDGELWLSATCRSLDFGKKAIHNLCNLAALGKKVAKSLELDKSKLLIHVISAHIYKEEWGLDVRSEELRDAQWSNILNEGSAHYGENLSQIKNILITNRGYVNDIPHDEHVILLFSGGMDSVSLIDVAIRNWNCKVILLYFKRSSKNQKWEEEAVDYFYQFYLERFPDNIIELIKIEIEIPLRLNKEHLDRMRQKHMGLPLRNAIMWDHAFAQAVYLLILILRFLKRNLN